MSGAARPSVMSKSRRVQLALTVVLLLLLGACSGAGTTTDEQAGASEPVAQAPQASATPSAAATTTSVTDFCNDTVELFKIASLGGSDREAALELTDDVESATPSEIQEPMEVFLGEVRSQSNLGESALLYTSEEFGPADSQIRSYLAENCEFEVIEVQATQTGPGEYAFEGMPATVAAGRYNIQLTAVPEPPPPPPGASEPAPHGSEGASEAPPPEGPEFVWELAVLRPVDPDANLERILQQQITEIDPMYFSQILDATEGDPEVPSEELEQLRQQFDPEQPAQVEWLDFGYAADFGDQVEPGHVFVDLEPGQYAIVNSWGYESAIDPDAFFNHGLQDVFQVQ